MPDQDDRAPIAVVDRISSNSRIIAFPVNTEHKAGFQEIFYAKDILPIEGMINFEEQLTAMGFIIDQAEIDSLFRRVSLPPGWKKIATDHSLCLDLVDNLGRKRAGIFFKAAFNDRKSYMIWCSRFSTKLCLADSGNIYNFACDQPVPIVAVVLDAGKDIVFSTNPETVARNNHEAISRLSLQTRKWLAANYPDWEKPFAYWEL